MNSHQKRRMRRFELDLPSVDKTFAPLDAGLTIGSHSMAQWMAQEFNHNFDAYDKAIDSVYNSTHIGGSQYHHLLDGQHSFLGSLQAVKDVSSDDSFVTELSQAAEHLLRDTASVSGINPFLSFTQHQFDRIADSLQQIGISKPFLADALTINSPELLGGSIALLGSLILGKKGDPSRISNLAGSYLVSSIASANPVLLPIAAGGLVYSLYKSEDKKKSLVQAGKGTIVSGSALAVGTLIGGPVWIGCLAAIGTAVAVKYTLDNPDKAFKRVQELVAPAKRTLRHMILQP